MGLHSPLLPPPARTGRPRADDRRSIEGILYVLVTGCRWQDLPRDYGAPTTVWQRLKRWGEEGVWEHIWRAALATLDRRGELDWSMAFFDGSFAPAKKGGDKVGLTKNGKGTKWMLVIDGNGLPLGFHLESATTAEVKLAEQTLDTICVSRPRGRPKQRPAKLVADRGYDSRDFRRALRRRGMQMCIPRGAVPPRGAPNGAVRSPRVRKTIGNGTKWSAALRGWAISGGCSCAGNTSAAYTGVSSQWPCC
jgi:transposase